MARHDRKYAKRQRVTAGAYWAIAAVLLISAVVHTAASDVRAVVCLIGSAAWAYLGWGRIEKARRYDDSSRWAATTIEKIRAKQEETPRCDIDGYDWRSMTVEKCTREPGHEGRHSNEKGEWG